MKWAPTDEQLAAVDLFAEGENLAIEAGAGTGKTSTLVLVADIAAGQGQYLAFNRSIVDESKRKMPAHVRCSTAHSLAFATTGRAFAHRLGSGRLRSKDIAQRLGVTGMWVEYGSQRKHLADGFLAGLVMRSITTFCQTADDAPSADLHVPYVEGIDAPASDGRRRWDNNRALRAHIAPALAKAWADLCDPDGSLPYKHDHYLKLYQLGGPRLPVDFLLFDEAQDASPVMLDIVCRQDHAQLVFVGDTNQQIYEWRGAVNALAQVPAGQRTYLTRSFRFGQPIADVANHLLGLIPSEMVLTGNPGCESTVGPVPDGTVLCRSNAGAVTTVLNGLAAGRNLHLVGGADEVVRFAKSAAELMATGWTSHPDLTCFSSWDEVKAYVADDPQGSELKLLVDLIEEFTVDTITDGLSRTTPERSADLVVSTAHKAKGREWDRVRLHSDFPDLDDFDHAAEELRLLYVAVTRARLTVDVSLVPALVGVPA